jgi:hypothetical protein
MNRKCTFFVLLRATKEWLSLRRTDRNRFVAEHLHPLFARYTGVSLRFYDAGACSTCSSNIAVFETADIQQYAFLMDGMRDSKVFTVPYFEFLEIIPAIEGGFAEYEKSLKQG